MDQIHRKILQTNRTKLIENITNPIDVVEKLFEKNVFTEYMKQEVEAEKTQHSQVRKILDTVPKRGPTAFNAFYESLVETLNEDAADILRPELQGSHPHHGDGERGYAVPQADVDLPENWPNEQAMTANVEVKPANVRSELVKKYWLSPNVYSMKKRCRGRCLIISNRMFHGPLEKDKKMGALRCILPTRHGTDKDVNDLKELFDQLHFDVLTRHELTAEDMQNELLREAAHTDHNQAECFVCVICSHGTKSGIYGTDGNIVSLENITKYFDGGHCKALQNKPKLFFIQACQGETSDRPGDYNVVDSVDAGQDLSHLLEKVHISGHQDETDASKESFEHPNPHAIPTKADMLVACATHPGYVSLRNTQYGSWFIQAVVYVFQKHAMDENILDLLTLVNRLVARGRTAINETGPRNVMQASQFTTSLTKKFLFFPGVISEDSS